MQGRPCSIAAGPRLGMRWSAPSAKPPRPPARSRRPPAPAPPLRVAITEAEAAIAAPARGGDHRPGHPGSAGHPEATAAEREAEAAAAEFERLKNDLARIDDDRAREEQAKGDAATALARIDAELEEVRALVAAAPERGPELEAAAKAAEAARAAAETRVEQLAARVAAEEAQGRAAAARLSEAEASAPTAPTAPSTRPRPSGPPSVLKSTQPAADARQRFANAEAALAAARAALEAAETERVKAAEQRPRPASWPAMSRTSWAACAPRRGPGPADCPTRQERPRPGPGQRRARQGLRRGPGGGAGDDLDAALDPKAPSYWAGAQVSAPLWPEGAQPLVPLVKAPPELIARLSHVAVVARADGDRLQKDLKPGMRLVSREGDPVALGRLRGPRRRPQTRRRPAGATHAPGRGRGRDRRHGPPRREPPPPPSRPPPTACARSRSCCATSGAVRPTPSAC
ncbi:hypothetical protein ACRAWD_13065 [Caulobacter segnis]